MMSLLLMLDRFLGRDRIQGMIRSTVQAGWATLFAQAWFVDALDWVAGVVGDPIDVTPLQATMVTIAFLWALGDKLQASSWVQGNRTVRTLVTFLMGGPSSPTYGAV